MIKRTGLLLVLGFLCSLFVTQAAWAKPNPRVLVWVMGDKKDTVASSVEEILIDMKFKMIDRNQLKNIKQVDAAVTTQDAKKLRFLKTRYGVEVIVAVKSKWEFLETRRVYGRRYRYHNASISMKAIIADTAQIVASKVLRKNNTARSNALDKLAKRCTRLVGPKIQRFWATHAYRQAEFEVVISKLPYSRLAKVQAYMKGLAKAKAVSRRSYAQKTAMFEVAYSGSRNQLEAALARCPNPKLEIVRTTANRIELKASQGYTPPPDTQAPTVKITSPSNNSAGKNRSIVVTGTVSDNRGVVRVTVSGKSAKLNGNNFTAVVGGSEGKNTITVLAFDKAGNQGSASVNRFLDLTAPRVKISVPMSGHKHNKKTITVVGRVVESNLQWVKVNGQLATVKGRKFTANIKVKDGRFRIRARARDIVGNIGSDVVSISVDTTPPKLTLMVEITGTVDKPGSRVWVNGKEVTVTNGQWRAKINIATTKKIVIIAVDSAGNRTVKVRKLGG